MAQFISLALLLLLSIDLLILYLNLLAIFTNRKLKMRFLLCGAEFATPARIVTNFVDSKDMKRIRKHYRAATAHTKNGASSKRTKVPIKSWKRSLGRSCELWMMMDECEKYDGHLTSSYSEREIVLLEKEYAEKLREPLWKIMCFLMKGDFCLEKGIPMPRILQDEAESPLLLHAAIGSLPACSNYCSHRQLAFVFEQVMETSKEQIDKVDPVCGQLPIHIAASNRGLLHCPTEGSTGFLNHQRERSIVEHMLKAIATASPPSALSTTANSLIPLEIACMHGHVWPDGTCLLSNLTPDTTAARAASAGILLAISTSLSTIANSKATAQDVDSTTTKKSWCLKMVKKSMRCWRQKDACAPSVMYYETENGRQKSLDTIYQLLRANPIALLDEVRTGSNE